MRRRRLALIVAATLVLWVALGILRAGPIATAAFARVHPGVRLADVSVASQLPLPPFWVVSIGGDVLEGAATSPTYRSAMILLIEPVIGWSATFATG